MKKSRNIPWILFLSLCLVVFSCNKNQEELWKKEVKVTEKVEIFDISGEFFDPKVSLKEFKEKYSMFQGSIPDAEYEARRKDTAEIRVYQEAVKGIDKTKLKNELSEMFSRVKHYFPAFKTPKVYLYSSFLDRESVIDPIFFRTDEGMLFVDISAFMGEKSKNYQGLDEYHKKIMNPENLVPRITEIVAETFLISNPQENKFIDQIILEGKIKTLQDAFLPNTPDYLKMNYSQTQEEWAEANEANIWNYFVENNMVFSDDPKLYERFLSVAPFSKFYTEIDQKSSPRVGSFIGWRICKAFYAQKPETKLSDFLKMNAAEIFNQSNYKPE